MEATASDSRLAPAVVLRLQAPEASPLDLRRDRLLHVLCLDPAPITLVCAPAGYGKTSLLAGWAAQSPGLAIAWLRLDVHDNDPRRLWAGILRSLVASGRFPADSPIHELRAPTTGVDPGFVDVLEDAVASMGAPLWLVFDDIHVLRHPEATASLKLLLGRAAPNLHLVLSGRTEPSISLSRLRVRGALKEIRAADLAFTIEETAEFVRRHEVALSPADLTVLHRRTEGWAAGLQIACMAVAGGEDPTALVARFDGDDHQVASYLLTEVMDGLPAADREFMLRTSICADVDIGLAQRLSERSDAARVLERLEKHNAFIRRVGRGRTTYRYHDLLRSFLVAELRRDDPQAERALRRTAAQWHQQSGDHLGAMEHLAAAGDTGQVIVAARSHGLASILTGEARQLSTILAALPEPERHEPVVALLLAAAAIEGGDTAEAGRWLVHLDLDASSRHQEPDIAILAAAVDTARARFDLDVHGPPARLETDLVGSSGDADLDLYALWQRGMARVYVGSYQAAVSDLQRATMLAREAGRDGVLVSCLSYLGGAYASMGALPESRQAAAEAVALAERRGWGSSQSIAHAQMLLGWIASLRGEQEAARHAALRAVASLGPRNEPDVELSARSLELYLFAGDEHAYDRLRSFVRLYGQLADVVDPALLGYAAPVLVQICLDLGERHWARELADTAQRRALGPGEQALLRAMLLDDAGQPAAARLELAPILTAEARCHLVTTEVRAWLHSARLEEDASSLTLAQHHLHNALQRAEPVELLQPFTETPRYTTLLNAGKGRFGRVERFVDRILEQLVPTADDHHDIPDRLTPTELEILRELPSLLTIAEIATARSVSVNTIKSHLRAIYRKLGVNGRRSAVKTARNHGLI